MTPSPDLPEQITHVLIALEKATPELLEMATRSFRMEALLSGSLYLALMTVAAVVGIWALRWLRNEIKKDSYNQADVVLFMAGVLSAACLVTVIACACLLPDQINQYTNARYYAVCDLLRRVKP